VKQPRSDRDPVLVDLALQGGGSHGAFTWGVLDRLLEEPWLRIDGISGTSAGAMNGAVLVAGFTAGGPEGARSALDAFWKRVSHSARFSPIRRSPLDIMLGRWTLDTSPFYLAFDLASRVFSPYDLAPRGTNPLRDVLADSVDFDQVKRAPIRLFVTAKFERVADASFATPRLRPTSFWRRPVCRRCSRPSKSKESPIGMAAIPAIRQSRPSSANASRETHFL
jgi:predicted acylesterase/phospholipase RssA